MSDLRSASSVVRKVLGGICVFLILAIWVVASVLFDVDDWAFWVIFAPGILLVSIGWLLGHMWFLMLASIANIESNTSEMLKLMSASSEPKQTQPEQKKDPCAPKTATAAPKNEVFASKLPESVKINSVTVCPKCGKSQFAGSKKCFSCGALLTNNEQ